MKRFRFKLQTVLEIRQAKEDALQAELAELKREEAGEIACLARLRRELRESWAELERALRRNAPADEVARQDEYSKTKRDDVRVQELTVRSAQLRVEAKREEVVEAMKERQVLESLRDRQEREHLRSQAAAEQKQLDDLATTRFARGHTNA